jgi:glycosyltransferase involved in cell wall biosynthesis
MKGRRVIFVLGNLELGGAERQALILAKHLKERENADVEIWGFNQSGTVATLCEQIGVRSRVVPCTFNGDSTSRITSLLRVAWWLRKARPEVLLPYTLVPNVVCGLVWKWTGARVCIWNQRDEGLPGSLTGWENSAVRETSKFIANSRGGAQFLIEQLQADPARVSVVQNGIEATLPKLDRREWRERLGIDDTVFVACMIANLHANKDHETLLRAWRLVIAVFEREGRKALLVLAGRPYAAHESLVALTKELEIEQAVCFTGQVDDVAGLLQASDIGVFSSRSEGCPNGLLECMAAGLAVAATDIPGIREVMGQSGVEFLAPIGDAPTLSHVILKLARDPALRAERGWENKKRISENYTAHRMCEEMLITVGAALRGRPSTQ